MGQDSSILIDEDRRPISLKDRSVEAVATYIKDRPAKKIVVLTGAGISTSAGIPDFRSPDTGLYANLARLNLPYAEAVFDIGYFRQNPLPFYILAHDLYPGKYKPTIAHCFVRLLSKKGLLLKLFTQNIDCLERGAGVPEDKIIEAHGSFASQSCIECKSAYPADMMKTAIEKKDVPYCISPHCSGLVKPDIVFFGEELPKKFHQTKMLPADADLCIIMGTSLTVQPFASLPNFCSNETPRVLINKERVGALGTRADDVLLLGDCDVGVRKLASALGWLDELENLWRSVNTDGAANLEEDIQLNGDEKLQDEIAKLAADIDITLQISNDHRVWVRDQILTAPTKNAKSHETPGDEVGSVQIVEEILTADNLKRPST